jgi:hypothetical protein
VSGKQRVGSDNETGFHCCQTRQDEALERVWREKIGKKIGRRSEHKSQKRSSQ